VPLFLVLRQHCRPRLLSVRRRTWLNPLQAQEAGLCYLKSVPPAMPDGVATGFVFNGEPEGNVWGPVSLPRNLEVTPDAVPGLEFRELFRITHYRRSQPARGSAADGIWVIMGE